MNQQYQVLRLVANFYIKNGGTRCYYKHPTFGKCNHELKNTVALVRENVATFS